MTITIIPGPLRGTVSVPPSKSDTHRSIIAAALADGTSVIRGVALSEDIAATLRCAAALGAQWTMEGGILRLTGIPRPYRGGIPTFDCGESGSTLRFFIPIALAVAGGGCFTGNGRLMERPLGPYFDLFREKSIHFDLDHNVLTLEGRLTGGEYALPGNISSQFFTGLLFALPLLEKQSRIIPTTALESRGYIGMTVETLRNSGIFISDDLSIPAHARYLPRETDVEGDWSQGAFWLAARDLGHGITITGLDAASLQPDRAMENFAGKLARPGDVALSAAQCPDLAPPLAARGALREGTLTLTCLARLRLKESDRLAAIQETLSALGADIRAAGDSLVILGQETLPGGVTISARGDHRIAMMLAVAATRCARPVTITEADCVAKSYPDFWAVFRSLGGIIHEHTGK